MAGGKFVSYLRVSTARQGRSGLGLEAQRQAVEDFLNGGNWQLAKEFVEIESGKKADRPQLAKAFQLCRVLGAKLVIAKLDRLSRDAHFLLGLEKAGVDFVAADMPQANRLTVGIMAVIAEDERRRISERTKAALAAAKRRGVKLGGDRGARLTAKQREAGRAALQAKARARAIDLAPTIEELRAAGFESLRAIATALDERGIPAARGGRWSAVQVARLLENAGLQPRPFEGYVESVGAGINCRCDNELIKQLKRCVPLVSRPSGDLAAAPSLSQRSSAQVNGPTMTLGVVTDPSPYATRPAALPPPPSSPLSVP
jgi:DNA invertase Pin-like site-specific DNA recombinase